MRLLRIIREISNYFYLLNVIRQNKNTIDWNKHKLRTNWVGTIATVINLPPDVFQGEEIYYQVYIIEQMKPINRYLESLNLQEIIYPRTTSLVDPNKGHYAYLIKYKPIFKDFSGWWLLTRSLTIFALYELEMRYSAFSKSYNFIAELIGKI